MSLGNIHCWEDSENLLVISLVIFYHHTQDATQVTWIVGLSIYENQR